MNKKEQEKLLQEITDLKNEKNKNKCGISKEGIIEPLPIVKNIYYALIGVMGLGVLLIVLNALISPGEFQFTILAYFGIFTSIGGGIALLLVIILRINPCSPKEE